MARVQLTGASWPTFPGGRVGPFKDASGNLWAWALDSASRPCAWLSTDGGASWTEQVGSSALAYTSDILDVVYDGSIFYILSLAGSAAAISSYDPSQATNLRWNVVASGGPTVSADANSQKPAFLARRSDGSFVVAYQGPNASVMGKSYRRVYYVTCSSAGVWGTGVEVDSGSTFNFSIKGACLGASNRVHMIYHNDQSQPFHRSLDSTNTLDTAASIGGLNSMPETAANIAWYDANWGMVEAMAGAGTLTHATSVANPTWSTTGLGSGPIDSGVNASNPISLIFPSTTFGTSGTPNPDELFAFFDLTTGGLTYSTNTATNSWGNTSSLSADQANGISTGLIASGIGFVYNDTTSVGVYFDHVALGAATKAITPGAISATSTFGGSVTARKLVKPATVSATSTLSGSVTARRKVAPAVVSATSTVSGAMSKFVPPKNIPPTTISATSTVSGGVVRRRPIAGTISALSTLSGLIVARRAISGVIAATSSVSGAVPALRRITGAIAATSVVSGAVHALRRIAPVTNILAAGTVAGAIGRKRPISGNVNAVSTISGAVVAYRRVAPATVLATSTVNGAVTDLHAGKTFGGSISATSAVSGSFVRRVAVSGVVSALSTLSGRVTARRAVGGAITAVSVVSGAIGRVRRLAASILATSTVAGSTTARHKIAGNVLATSVVTGTVTRHGTGNISGNISATSTVAGSVVRLLPLVGATINAPATVSGSTGIKRRIVGNIVATSAVSGVVHLKLPVSGGIFATSTLSGQIAPLRGVGGNVIATSTVSGTVVFQRVISGAILAPATVSGAIRLKPTTVFVYGPGHQGVILYTGAGTIQDQPSGGRIPVQSRRGVIR